MTRDMYGDGVNDDLTGPNWTF